MLVERLIKEAGLQPEAPLFQGWDGRKPLAGLNGESAKDHQMRGHLVKGLALLLDLPEAVVKKAYGTHSFRSGGATAIAAMPGVEQRVLQAHGGWKSQTSMHAYIVEPLDTKLGATAAMGY